MQLAKLCMQPRCFWECCVWDWCVFNPMSLDSRSSFMCPILTKPCGERGTCTWFTGFLASQAVKGGNFLVVLFLFDLKGNLSVCSPWRLPFLPLTRPLGIVVNSVPEVRFGVREGGLSLCFLCLPPWKSTLRVLWVQKTCPPTGFLVDLLTHSLRDKELRIEVFLAAQQWVYTFLKIWQNSLEMFSKFQCQCGWHNL